MSKPKIGIRPIIDGRRMEGLEEKAFIMAKRAKELIEANVKYADGTAAECVISPCAISGSREAYICKEAFDKENVVATLSVTPCWCFGSETMDMDPLTIKAVWGANGTERPGAVYLASVLAAHEQKGLPAFSIYGRDVQDTEDQPIPADVAEKILRFARCAVAVGQMRDKSYVNIGAVSMGIAGSQCDADFFQRYLGIRAEWVDMTEILRRRKYKIYDEEEVERAFAWTKKYCKEGFDKNPEPHTAAQKAEEWRDVVINTIICRDIILGNEKLAAKGYIESGRRFPWQRSWADACRSSQKRCSKLLRQSPHWAASPTTSAAPGMVSPCSLGTCLPGHPACLPMCAPIGRRRRWNGYPAKS